MKNKGTKLLSFILAFIMIVCVMPVNSFVTTASEPNDAEAIDELTAIEAEIESIDTSPIREITSLREENVKHFRLPDGTYEMIVYDYPVHRKDANGEWQDINNNLTHTMVSGTGVYSTSDDRFVFSNNVAQKRDLISVNENGYKISMSILSNQSDAELATMSIDNESISVAPITDSPAIITNSTTSSRAVGWDTIEEATAIDNKASILYEDVFSNTDIEYVMVGNNVKENIIVKSPANNYEYAFSLSLTKLVAECDTYGNIRLLDTETNDCKYIMPVPFMYDAAGALSYDVHYDLTNVSDGTYVVSVTANSDWINSPTRAFPVTIDPSINTNTNISDTHVWQSYPNTNYGSNANMFVSPTSIALIKFDIPNIPDGATLNVPNMYVYYYSNASTSNTKIGAYKILSSWNENTVTWNTKPTIDSTIQSNATLYHSTDNTSDSNKVSVRFSIRSAVEDWLENPSANYGIAINYISGVTSEIYLNTVESGTQYPRVSISYNFEFEDGIYAIKNMSSSTSYLNSPSTSYLAGDTMRRATYSSESSVLSDANRGRLFKISYDSGNRYIIRLMQNNNLTFGISETSVVTKEIPPLDDDVASADTFYIEWDGYGFLLRPYGSDNVIRINSTSSSTLSVVEKSSASATARWTLVKYNYDQTYCGVSAHGLYTNMKMGKSYELSPYYWTTLIDVEPQISINDAYSTVATGTWNAATQRFALNLHEPGNFSVSIQILKDGVSAYEKVLDIQSSLLVENGSYFVKNVKLENYMRMNGNSDAAYNESGQKIEVSGYSGHHIQIWEFTYLGAGYYQIKSAFSNLALAVRTEYVNTANKYLVQETSSQLATQKWKISQSSSGNLVFRPMSAESYTTDWCMSAGTGILITDGRDVEQREYTEDSDYKDEWKLFSFRKTMLLALLENGEDRALFYDEIKEMLVSDEEGKFMAVEILEYEYTAKMINYLQNNEIVVLHTHGDPTGIYFGVDSWHPTAVDNYIRIDDLQNVDLSNLEFAFLLTCNTAIGYDESHITDKEPVNIIEQFVISGAETVVGFNNYTNVYAGNIFVKEVFKKMKEEKLSVYDAIDDIDSSQWIQDIQKLAVIAGNGNYTID